MTQGETAPLMPVSPSPSCPSPRARLTVGWYFSQFSHQACVFCSKQMLRFKIWANS